MSSHGDGPFVRRVHRPISGLALYLESVHAIRWNKLHVASAITAVCRSAEGVGDQAYDIQ